MLPMSRFFLAPQIIPCIFSSSDSADRVLPVLPNCTLRPDMFLPSVAAPSHEVERYQRLRIFRALGSLPAHVTLVTGSGGGDSGIGGGNQEQAHPPGNPVGSQHAGVTFWSLGTTSVSTLVTFRLHLRHYGFVLRQPCFSRRTYGGSYFAFARP